MEKENLFSMNGPYARVMNWLWNLIVLSVLWVLCCIPVVTIGAASTAAYYTAAKVLRAHEGKVVSEFFHAFKTNFKPATLFTVCYIAVILLLVLDCVYLYDNSEVPLPVLYLFYGLVLLVFSNGQYLFSCLSRFTDRKFQLFRMAVLSGFRHLLTTILLLLLLAALLVGFYLMPWGILVFPGLMFWIKTFLMEPVLRGMMPESEESDPEKRKWYYNI